MENLLNLSLIEGRLTRDPEVTNLKDGLKVCEFDLAVNSEYKSGNETKKDVNYFRISTWNRLAEACSKYLKKGSKVRVNGRLKQESWVGKDGKKGSKVVVDANSVDFIESGTKNKETVPF